MDFLSTKKKFRWCTCPTTSSQQKYFYFFLISILMLLWALYAHHFISPIFPLDDGYIVLHNAQVLHWGFDPNYTGVSALDGTTSAVYLAFVALLIFWISPPWALITSAWLGIICYAFALSRLAFVYSASLLQTLLFCLVGLSIGFVSFQFFNGLETVWALAALTGTLITASGADSTLKRVGRNLLCGLMPFLRPELFIFSFILFLYQGTRYHHDHSLRVTLRMMLVDAVFMLMVALPWIFWYWKETGSLIPQTILAKKYFFAEYYLPFDSKLKAFINNIFIFSWTLGYVSFPGMILLLFFTPLGRVSFLFVLMFFLIYFINGPDDIIVNVFRYIYLLLPILLFGVISCIHHPKKMIVWMANGLIIYLSVYSILFFLPAWNVYLKQSLKMNHKVSQVTMWCQQHLPPDATILIHDAGYIAYATSFHLVDMVGLKTPSVIPYQKEFTYFSGGTMRNTAIAKIMEVKHPGYLIDLPRWEKFFGITPAKLFQLGWHLQLLKSFPEGYQVYRVQKIL